MGKNIYIDNELQSGITEIKFPDANGSSTYNSFYAADDATVTASDIAYGKTAYIGSGKITGTGSNLSLKSGAKGPRLRNIGSTWPQDPISHACWFQNGDTYRKASTAIDTGTVWGQGWNSCGKAEAIDLGEGYILFLYQRYSNYQLYGRVCYVNDSGVVTAGEEKQISSSNYSGFQFCACALRTSANAATNKVFVAHSKDSTTSPYYKLVGNILTITKSTSAPTISTVGTETALDTNAAHGYVAYQHMSCCVMEYVNGSGWYIQVMCSSGTNATSTGSYLEIACCSVTSGASITAGTCVQKTGNYNNNPGSSSGKIIRLSNTLSICFSGYTSNLYATGITRTAGSTYCTIGTPVLGSTAYSGYGFDAVPISATKCLVVYSSSGYLACSIVTVTTEGVCTWSEGREVNQLNTIMGSYSTNNYLSFRPQCIRINPYIVYVFTPYGKNYICGTKIVINPQKTNWTAINDYSVGSSDTGAPGIINDSSSNLAPHFVPCFCSNNGHIVVFHHGGGNAYTIYYTTIYGQGLVNGPDGAFGITTNSAQQPSGSFVETTFYNANDNLKDANIFEISQ